MKIDARARGIALVCLSSAVGGLATSGNAVVLSLTAIVPAIWLHQQSRWTAYLSAFSYYAAATWPVIVVMRALPATTRPNAICGFTIWLVASVVISMPWALVWSKDRCVALWLTPLAQCLGVIPPIGLIGVASPIASTGLLLPGTGWFGLFLVVMLPGILRAWPRSATGGLLICVAVAHAAFGGLPRTPDAWQGVNTTRGATKGVVNEYAAVSEIVTLAQESTANVVVFPETAVPRWTTGGDAFWETAFAQLRVSGKTVLFGSTVAIRSPARLRDPQNLTEAIAVLRGNRTPGSVAALNAERSYYNVILMRGAQSGIFFQRVPVPIGMWHPLSGGGVPLTLSGPETVEINGQRAAILICYEQLLTWPILNSAMRSPSILIGVSNTRSIYYSPIARLQLAYLQSWARLFGLCLVTASNV